ncbi:hypothetical protein [Micromonospora rubida]
MAPDAVEQVRQAMRDDCGLGVGDRAAMLKWLLAPLVAGASVVAYANLDPARRDGLIAAGPETL